MASKKIAVKQNVNESYYQISTEILDSFPKYRPPVDLFAFREDIAVLAPYCGKGTRISNEQVEELANLCEQGCLFVSRSDQHIYAKHIIKQLDLILQDGNLTESEVAEISIRAIMMRYDNFYNQPVAEAMHLLYRDVMVFTEYIWQDKHRINAFLRRIFRQHTQTKHALNSMIVGVALWLRITPEHKRKELDRVALALLLHDVGMSKVPNFIIVKTTFLKSEEREKILPHPLAGAKMLHKSDYFCDEMARACLEHHERLDGSGYPQKLKDKQISTIGRLSAVVDSFVAMITKRVYAKAKDIRAACNELLNDAKYDHSMAQSLTAVFFAGKIGQMIDMDAKLETLIQKDKEV